MLDDPRIDSNIEKLAIVSGHFNPLHRGHVETFNEARRLGDALIVVVSNDFQQEMKKGSIIEPAEERLYMVRALSVVDDAFISVDKDGTMRASVRLIRATYPDADLSYFNMGNAAYRQNLAERDVCEELGIRVVFGDDSMIRSSTEIGYAAARAYAPELLESDPNFLANIRSIISKLP